MNPRPSDAIESTPMPDSLISTIRKAAAAEPFARTLGIRVIALGPGHSVVEMDYQPATMANLFGRAHGGAIFALIDEAFETAGQTDGTVAVALNVNVTYVASPAGPTRLRAEANRISQTPKTAGYDISVTDEDGRLIATCRALAYRTGKPPTFGEAP